MPFNIHRCQSPFTRCRRFAKMRHPVCTVLLILLFSAIGVDAETTPKVQRMPYADLEKMITQGEGNYLLAFMAAWCAPCKEELPILNRLYRNSHPQDIQILGISIDAGGPAAIERILKKSPVEFPVYWVGDKVVRELKLVGIPMIYILKNGKIIEKIPGKCSYDFLKERIGVLTK